MWDVSSLNADSIRKQIREKPFRTIGVALLAGAWLGYEPAHRRIAMGLVRMLVMSELRGFVDALPGVASAQASFAVDQGSSISTVRA
jgi:hypothetical protein